MVQVHSVCAQGFKLQLWARRCAAIAALCIYATYAADRPRNCWSCGWLHACMHTHNKAPTRFDET